MDRFAIVTILVTIGSVGLYLYETTLDGGDDGEEKSNATEETCA